MTTATALYAALPVVQLSSIRGQRLGCVAARRKTLTCRVTAFQADDVALAIRGSILERAL